MAKRRVYVRDRRGRFARVRGTAASDTLAALRGRRLGRGKAVKIVGRKSLRSHLRQSWARQTHAGSEFDEFGMLRSRGYTYKQTHINRRTGRGLHSRYDRSGTLLRSNLVSIKPGVIDFRGRRVVNYRGKRRR